MKYESGDYFGELALLQDEPRAANVVAQVNNNLIKNQCV
jgi:CRP-like cAMP-binding protein